MLFHTTRSALDRGHTQFSDGGRLITSKSSDNKEIYSKEGLGITMLGYSMKQEHHNPLTMKIF